MTAVVIFVRLARSRRSRHVRFAPKANKRGLASLCPLCADSVAKVLHGRPSPSHKRPHSLGGTDAQAGENEARQGVRVGKVSGQATLPRARAAARPEILQMCAAAKIREATLQYRALTAFSSPGAASGTVITSRHASIRPAPPQQSEPCSTPSAFLTGWTAFQHLHLNKRPAKPVRRPPADGCRSNKANSHDQQAF